MQCGVLVVVVAVALVPVAIDVSAAAGLFLKTDGCNPSPMNSCRNGDNYRLSTSILGISVHPRPVANLCVFISCIQLQAHRVEPKETTIISLYFLAPL